MRSQRTAVLLGAVAALAAASPAGAINGGAGISKALHSGPGAIVVSAAALGQEKDHQCQAGERNSRAANKPNPADRRNPTVVACEQPPKSQVLTPDTIAKATAAAIAALG
jgi:hypothetical protein